MKYCLRCVMPTTRPGLQLDVEGVCSACRWQERKADIDWDRREQELRGIADWARSESRAPWHCVVGVSGGKDSLWQAFYLRDRLGLNPLLVQFVGSDGTDLGRRNSENMVRQGFTLLSVQPNSEVARQLALKSFLNYGNIVKYSEYALYATPFRTAMIYGIPLVFFGENPALEAGDTNAAVNGWDATSIYNNNTLAGQGIDIWLGDGVEERDLIPYRFPTSGEFAEWKGRGIFMGFYLDWSGYRNGVFSIRHGLECLAASPREIGNPYLHNSLDCNNAIVNSMLKHMKLGFGHATEFASYDVRAGRISRAQAIRIIQELDGRCHPRFIKEFCDWVGISQERFWEVANSYRGAMWRSDGQGGWKLDEPIWETEKADMSIDVDALVAQLDTRRKAREEAAS